VLEKLGLAWDVKVPAPEKIANRLVRDDVGELSKSL